MNSNIENTSYENLNEEERLHREKRKIFEGLLYLYYEKELQIRVKEMDAYADKIKNYIRNELHSGTLSNDNLRKAVKQSTNKAPSLKYQIVLLDQFEKKFENFEIGEKDGYFIVMNQNLKKTKETAQKMEKQGGMKKDNDWNLMRENLTDLSDSCDDFINSEKGLRAEDDKETVSILAEFAQNQKEAINKQQEEMTMDFNAKMAALVKIYQETHAIKTFIEESGLIPKSHGKSTDAYEMNDEDIGRSITKLLKLHKSVNELRGDGFQGVNEIDEIIMDNMKNILNYLESNPNAKKGCGLSDENLKSARMITEDYYYKSVKIEEPVI